MRAPEPRGDSTVPSADPIDIFEASPTALGIAWKDGHRSVFPFMHLRVNCPCATCNDLRGKFGPVLTNDELRVKDIKPVGRYALTFDWSDGHSTGIYSFEFLRSLCPCDECRAAQGAARP